MIDVLLGEEGSGTKTAVIHGERVFDDDPGAFDIAQVIYDFRVGFFAFRMYFAIAMTPNAGPAAVDADKFFWFSGRVGVCAHFNPFPLWCFPRVMRSWRAWRRDVFMAWICFLDMIMRIQ